MHAWWKGRKQNSKVVDCATLMTCYNGGKGGRLGGVVYFTQVLFYVRVNCADKMMSKYSLQRVKDVNDNLGPVVGNRKKETDRMVLDAPE